MKETLHATAVACEGRGLLICGRSGAGKSALALQMMALGAVLIADDRTVLSPRDGGLWMSAPDTIRGMIEARGMGLLNAATTEAPLHLIVDLDVEETDRLPHIRKRNVLGVEFRLLHNIARPYFPAALVQYLKAGCRE